MNYTPKKDSPPCDWTSKLLGIPWKAGGRGKGSFDCWGLLRHVYIKQLGVKLPDVPVGKNTYERSKQIGLGLNSGDWTQLEKPTHLCGVALSKSGIIHHVGVYLNIDRGLILHCHEKSGVIIEQPSRMRQMGWSTIKYYGLNSLHQ